MHDDETHRHRPEGSLSESLQNITPEEAELSASILQNAEDNFKDPKFLELVQAELSAVRGQHTAVVDEQKLARTMASATVQHLEKTFPHLHTTLRSPGLSLDTHGKKSPERVSAERFMWFFGAAINRDVHQPAQTPPAEEQKSGSSRWIQPSVDGLIQPFAKVIELFVGKNKHEQFKENYGSIIQETRRRILSIGNRMKRIGEENVDLRLATSLTTLAPFTLAGEARRGFEYAQQVLWWLNRTGRNEVVNRRGELPVGKEPADEFLRSEQSSFPIAYEIEPTSLGELLSNKLERYAANKKEYMLDKDSGFQTGDKDRVRVLLWFGRKPRYIEVPLKWFEGPRNAVVPSRLDSLIFEAQNSGGVELTPEQMQVIRNESYGKFSEQSNKTQMVLGADLSIVVGSSAEDVSLDLSNPKNVMENPAFVTGGARMRECLAVNAQVNPENGKLIVSGVAERSAHYGRDGKRAMDEIRQDTARRRPASSASSSVMSEGRVMYEKSSHQAFAGWSPEAPQPSESQKEYLGFLEVDRAKSQYWIDAVSVLRLVTGNEFGLADLMSYAQMLSSRTQGSHFLESHQAPLSTKDGVKQVEVLDVAYNILPDSLLLSFDYALRMQEESQAAKALGGKREPVREDLKHEGEKRELLQLLLLELKDFRAERKLAKQGKSLASFMSTLAGSIKNIEKIMSAVSKQGFAVGELITQAVGNPRGGLISMLAETQRLPDSKPGEPKWLWFGSANTDSFIPTSDQEGNKAWGGVLGITSVPDKGFSFLLRKLGVQSQEPRERGAAELRLKEFLKNHRSAKNNELQGKSLEEVRALLDKYDVAMRKSKDERLSPELRKAAFEEVPLLFGPVLLPHTFAADIRAKVFAPYDKRLKDLEDLGKEQGRSDEAQAQVEDIPKALDFILELLAQPVRNLPELVRYYQERVLSVKAEDTGSKELFIKDLKLKYEQLRQNPFQNHLIQ